MELWLTLADELDGDTADHKLCLVLSALTDKQEVMDQILSRLDMVNVLASMVPRSTEKIHREIAMDLGYGSAEPPAWNPLSSPSAVVIGARPTGLGSPIEISSLQVVDSSERKKQLASRAWLLKRADSADRTFDIGRNLKKYSVHWSLENPASSFLWDILPIQALADRPGVRRFVLDMCQFGSPHRKPTALLSESDLSSVALTCDRDLRPHDHEPLVGTVIVNGKKVFKTRLAQVYPEPLCQQWAAAIAHLHQDPLALTFAMAIPANDRKRPLGQPLLWTVRRQRHTAEKARDAGYQLKRSALPPLFHFEMEPGQAVRTALQVVHPFTKDPALEPDLQEALACGVHRSQQVFGQRQGALWFWAERLLSSCPLLLLIKSYNKLQIRSCGICCAEFPISSTGVSHTCGTRA
eukprot:s271_g39.t1